MEKKNKKNILLNLLNSKAVKLSDIIEQNIEEILNELIANNYRIHENAAGNLIAGDKNIVKVICGEIDEISINILENNNAVFFKSACKKKYTKRSDLIRKTVRIIKFAEQLRNIHHNIELIKININELYKYPVFKNQIYIAELCLALSSFFKENIDRFFMDYADNEEIKNLTAEKLSKVISLGNRIINEFYVSITSENKNNLKDAGQVIYHSNIISLIELISINSVEFTLL